MKWKGKKEKQDKIRKKKEAWRIAWSKAKGQRIQAGRRLMQRDRRVNCKNSLWQLTWGCFYDQLLLWDQTLPPSPKPCFSASFTFRRSIYYLAFSDVEQSKRWHNCCAVWAQGMPEGYPRPGFILPSSQHCCLSLH